MPIITNNLLYESTSETVTKPNVSHRAILDFLTSCSHTCKGCFVNKGNKSYVEHDLDLLYETMKSVNESGAIFDEIVVGPVDFFGATNSYQLLKEPRMQQIMREFKPIFAIPTTLMVSEETINSFIDWFNQWYNLPMLEFEMQVVVPPSKLMNDDREFIDQLKSKIRLFDRMIARVCYTIQINVQSLKNISLHEISLKVRDEFHTVIDINPSFYRAENPRMISKMISMWNKTLSQQVTDSNKADIQMILADKSHSGENANVWHMRDGQWYLMPFVHEVVPIRTDRFFVSDNQSPSAIDLNAKVASAKADQWKYVANTHECGDCSLLPMCISRNVLLYMEDQHIRSCVLPKDVIMLYNDGLGELPHQIYDWRNYSTADEIVNGNKTHHEFAKEKGIL